MKFLLTVMGLVMILEGLPYFAFPEKMQQFMRQLQEMPPDRLRWVGLVSMLLGLGLCYVTQRTGLFS